jgi:hypothetical protein
VRCAEANLYDKLDAVMLRFHQRFTGLLTKLDELVVRATAH